MKKTFKMLGIEERIGEPLESYLERVYVDQGMSAAAIADGLGIARTTMVMWLKEGGVPVRGRSEARLPEGISRPSGEELRRAYVDERMSATAIADGLGIARTTIRAWLKEEGIPMRSISEAKLPEGVTKPSGEELRRMYVEERRSILALAENLDVSHATVGKWLKEEGIPMRNGSEAQLSEGISRPSGEELRRMYAKERMSTYRIADGLGVTNGTIRNWLIDEGIPMRSISEARLPKGITKPSGEELRRMYVEERMTATVIGRNLGVTDGTIMTWLKDEGIPVKSLSEAMLPEGVTKPSGEELRRMYVEERMTATQIAWDRGVSNTTIGKWLKDEGIPMRDISEAHLPEGVVKPSKEELERMYVNEGMSATVIGRNLGVGKSTLVRWLKNYDIPMRGSQRITDSKQLISFLHEDETARNLSATALYLNGEAYDIEQIILETYEGKFRDQSHLHSLLEESEQEIYGLIEGGLTNLGAYIGKFSLEDRSIIPMLLGEAIMSLPEDKVTPSLEERLVRILRNQYSPRFNADPEGTLLEIEAKVELSDGKAKTLYDGLREHYQSVLELQEELK